MNKEAKFSEDRKFRYWLKRQWDNNKPSINFICLNPSKANEEDDDPTVTKCIRQAEMLGFGSIEMTNLFAFVDTNRDTFYDVSDPVGKDNDSYILKTAKKCDKVIIAWGNEGVYKNRAEIVLKMLRKLDKKIYCLLITQENQPRHPGQGCAYVERLRLFSEIN